MTRLSNSFDGGTNGVTITTGNSGGVSGDAFDDVTVGGTGTLQYNSANSKWGGMAAAIDPAVSGVAYMGYTDSMGTEVYGRAYVLLPSLPPATGLIALVTFRDSVTSSNFARLTIEDTGRIRLVDQSGVNVATSLTSLVAGSWARVEWHFTGSLLAGALELKIFLSPESTTPTQTVTATGMNTGGAVDRLRIGQGTASGSDIATFYVDEVVWDTAGYIGPNSAQVAPGLLDASGVLFTPKANRNLTVGIITQSPTLFTPNVRKGVNVPLMDATATLFAPGKLNQVVGSTSAFQNDAFQNDAFQTGQVFFIHANPVLFTPSVNQTVVMPGTVSAGGAFQADAFQADAFQTTGGGGPTIDQSAVVFTPELVQGTAGASTVVLGLIDQSGVLFMPVALSGLVVPLLDQSGVLFAPTASDAPIGAQFVYMDGGQGWDSSEIFWDGETLWDASGVGGNIDQSPQLFAPSTVSFTITVPLLDASATLFAPSVASKTVTVGLINASGFLFTPSIDESVQVPLLDASPELFDWEIQTAQQIDADFLDASGVLFAPTVNPQYLDVPLIDAEGFLFAPSVNESIEVPLIDASGVVFDPTVGPVIYAEFIDASPEVFIPSLERVFLDLLDASGVVFEPFVNLPFAQTIRLDDSILQFLDASPQVFEPSSIDVAPPQTITFFSLLDASGIVFAPRVFVPTRPVIRLRGRYDPVITLKGKYDPIISKRGQLARQG